MFRVLDKALGTAAAVALVASAALSGAAQAASASVVLAQASTSSNPAAGVPGTANPGTPAGASTQTAAPETGVQPKATETTSTAPATASTPAAKASNGPHREQHVEARIKELHAKLKITPQQESAWNDFANAMRDDARQMDELFAESHNNGPLTALQQLQNYQKFTDTHAEGVRKLVPAFETLYNSFSDDQKKNADAVFAADRAKHEQHRRHVHKNG